MARTGVTYHDIAKAAEALKTQSKEPTVDRVREHLGTGSKSTIAPLLKQWRANDGKAADTSGLPKDLLDVVQSLHERVEQKADSRVEKAREEFKVTNDSLMTELSGANSVVTELTARQKDLNQQVEQLSAERNQQNKALEDTRVSLATAVAQRDEAVKRATEFKEAIEELKQENRDIRDHFDHYQQRTAEDRQLERERFRVANQQLQDQLQERLAQHTQTERKISELVSTNAQLQQNIDTLKQVNATLKHEKNLNIEIRETLNRDLENETSNNKMHQTQKENLTAELTVLTSEKATVDKEAALLSQLLEINNAELKSAKENISLLADENKVILQEKALIQGQFQQLQNSLAETVSIGANQHN